ncbi:uncharacterized protein [Bactrocera oleae]|uniref:uncharacterized protein n=1 Tax=Bactrocera oleae TaxID=104688 RepID=UPI00387E4517
MAVRRSFRAFPTSSIKSILAESGMPHINERLEINTLRLIPKVYLGSNPNLLNDIRSATRKKRTSKFPSTIHLILKYVDELDIHLSPKRSKISKHPPWALDSSVIEDKLMTWNKASTNYEVYKQEFMQRQTDLYSEGWKFIYTDGSKNPHNTAYAVVSENSEIIKYGLLLSPSSVFTAEAYAIKEAIQWITSSKGKYVICTDSLATVTAIRNTSNSSPLISEIRDKLIDSRNKIKIMWIPGHCGIPGNELADKEAKNATLSPCIYVRTNGSNDILRFVVNFSKLKAKAEWYTYDNRYRLVNPELRKAVYPSTCSIPEIQIFTRLRLGHTILTHQHILDRNITPGCRLCNSPTNSVEHILNICPTFRHIRRDYVESSPSKLLKEPSTANIKEIYNFISRAQLKHLI